jgi:hypothetical protein
MSIPEYGSLQNRANEEYRCNHATKLREDYSSPDCLMNFQHQDDGSYAIKNVKNNEYFDCSITTMSDRVSGDDQKWRLLDVPEVKNGYYVQNKTNNEFMTRHASQLSNGAGKDEIWIIEPRKK